VINYRLASAINPPASPSTNLRFHWLSDLQFRLGSVLRLASAINPLALSATNSQLPWRLHPSVSPSVQPPTCVGCCSSGLSSGPTSNPSSALWPSSLPFNRLPACAGYRIVQFCLRTRPAAFTACLVLQLSFWTDLQLASDIESSSSAFQPTSDSSSDIASLTSPSDQLPTCVGAPSSSSAFRPTFLTCVRRFVLGLSLRISLRLASAAAFSGSVSDQPSTSFGV